MIMNPVVQGGGQSGGYDLMRPTETVYGMYTLDGTEKAIYAETVFKADHVQLILDFLHGWKLYRDTLSMSSRDPFAVEKFDDGETIHIGGGFGIESQIDYDAGKIYANTIRVYK